VSITHPFHPYGGRLLVCVAERANLYGRRLLLAIDPDTICAVPERWTDQVAAEPEVVIGQGRALLRVADLLALEQLLARLDHPHTKRSVKEIAPQMSAKFRRKRQGLTNNRTQGLAR